METTKINNLKINVLTKNQYDIANKDENQIYLITDNTETESSKGIIYLIASGTDTVTTSSENNNITELKNGDRFSITFTNALNANATLNINGIGNYPIIDNYTSEAIVFGDISAGYIGDIMFKDERFVLLNAVRPIATPQGYQMFTTNDTFVVPAGIRAIRVSACAAGVSPYAGEGILNQVYNVTPGQEIPLTIGTGNTVIGDIVTLVAGSTSSSVATTKLGYATGYRGGSAAETYDAGGIGGYGGFFGFGGGGGGYVGYNSSGTQLTNSTAGGSGAGIGGAGKTAASNGSEVAGGGSTGGTGGSTHKTYYYSAGGDATQGSLIYNGGSAATGAKAGGKGSIYGAGGGGGCLTGASPSTVTHYYGGGGGAGGYGAGGGDSKRSKGTPSNGMVLIEWGGTVGE